VRGGLQKPQCQTRGRSRYCKRLKKRSGGKRNEGAKARQRRKRLTGGVCWRVCWEPCQKIRFCGGTQKKKKVSVTLFTFYVTKAKRGGNRGERGEEKNGRPETEGKSGKKWLARIRGKKKKRVG